MAAVGSGAAVMAASFGASASPAGPPRAATCDPSVQIDPATDQRFRKLGAQHNVMFNGVSVGVGARGRGLFATRKMKEDELLARVPLAHCLIHQRSENVQEDQDWPFWLASRLLKESSETGLWAKYRENGFLPSDAEATATLPNAAPTEWLQRFAHWPIVNKLRQHREQTQWLYAKVTGRPNAPSSLLCAQALVLSRSFGLSEGNELIGLVPFLDMLNHAERPNTKLHVDVRREQVYAYALTDIEPGEELVIMYADGGVPNAALLMKYGFTLKGNSSSLLLLTDAESRFMLDPIRLMAYLDQAHAGWDTTETIHLRTVLHALPVLVEGGVTIDAERSSASGLLGLLRERLVLVKKDAADPDLGPLALLIEEELGLLQAAVSFLEAYLASLH